MTDEILDLERTNADLAAECLRLEAEREQNAQIVLWLMDELQERQRKLDSLRHRPHPGSRAEAIAIGDYSDDRRQFPTRVIEWPVKPDTFFRERRTSHPR